jgi:hypothetical protein
LEESGGEVQAVSEGHKQFLGEKMSPEIRQGTGIKLLCALRVLFDFSLLCDVSFFFFYSYVHTMFGSFLPPCPL